MNTFVELIQLLVLQLPRGMEHWLLMDTIHRLWVIMAAALFTVMFALGSVSDCVSSLCYYGHLLVYAAFDASNLIHFFQHFAIALIIIPGLVSAGYLGYMYVCLYFWDIVMCVFIFFMVSGIHFLYL